MEKYGQHIEHPLVIGVTGGMGCGQSTVCSFLEEFGCKVINADKEAKNVIQYNRILQGDLKKVFGSDIFFKNRRLNTKRLAELAFKDEINTLKLNQLVHPRMVESIIEKMEKSRFSGKYPIIVVDAALIYEISIERNFDYMIVVSSPLRERQKRAFERDNISKNDFNDRVSKQIPLEDKVKWADYVIHNKGTIEDLEKNTKVVFDKIMAGETKKVSARTRKPKLKNNHK